MVRKQRGSRDMRRRREPPGPAISSGSVLLLLQLTETGSLEQPEPPIPILGAVTDGVSVISRGSTLNKTKENDNTEMIVVEGLTSN